MAYSNDVQNVPGEDVGQAAAMSRNGFKDYKTYVVSKRSDTFEKTVVDMNISIEKMAADHFIRLNNQKNLISKKE